MSQVNLSNSADINAKTVSVLQQAAQLKQPKIKQQTFGQRLADSMAAKVGSWVFIGAKVSFSLDGLAQTRFQACLTGISLPSSCLTWCFPLLQRTLHLLC